jgi:hypothetical protein
MCGEDVAVWIPVKPRVLRRNEKGEAFRLLILATKQPTSPSFVAAAAGTARPPASLGGKGRTLADHLAAFHRLVELGTSRLYRVQRRANEHNVRPYVTIEEQLGRKG